MESRYHALPFPAVQNTENKLFTKFEKFEKNHKKYLQKFHLCVRILFVSGDGGMADALDSGSSGSSSCEGSSPFLRIE